MQPILKSKSTSFMFNKKICEMKGKKFINPGGGGAGGIIQIASWKCNFSIYLDIQAITTPLGLLLVLYVLLPSIYSFFYLTTTQVTFPGTKKSLQSTVFNVQASGWVHCEEETGAYYQLYRHTHKLVKIFFTNF